MCVCSVMVWADAVVLLYSMYANISNWIMIHVHCLDIASVMEADGSMNYCAKGMTGRPTRTMVYVLNYDL